MSDSKKLDSRWIFIPAPFVAKSARWACSKQVPGEIHVELDAIDRSLRTFGDWKAGSAFRVESGGIYLRIEASQRGKDEVFDAEGYSTFMARARNYLSVSAIHDADPQDDDKKRREVEALQALEGRDPKAIEKLGEVLSAVKGSLEIQVGEAKKPVILVGGDRAFVNPDVPRDPRVCVAERRDYLLLTIEGYGSILVESTEETEFLQVGDEVELSDITTFAVQRCIRALEARIDTENQGEIFPNPVVET